MAKQISYSLRINDAPAPAAVLGAVQRIEVEDHASMADVLRLRLATAVREDGSGWSVLDDGLFPRLAKVEVAVSVGSGDAVPLLTAYVVEVEVGFSMEPGGSLMTVVALDPTVLMHLEEKVKPWPDMQDSDVASAIFADGAYRFDAVVEATGWSRKQDDHTLIQRGTDIQFLRRLAERNGYECYVTTNDRGAVEGHFHPPRQDGDPQGTLTVNMGAATNVNGFRVRYDMLGPAQATAATVDPDDASTQDADAAEADGAGKLGADPAAPTDRPRKVLLSGLAMAQSGEAQRYAQAVVDRTSWAVVAEGDLNTAAYGSVLRAKKPVLVRGAGTVFSGRYYAERVRHTITADGTYTQAFTLRRNATGVTGAESFGART